MKRLARVASLALPIVGAAALSLPAAASAEIYGWVDSSGGVTYSNLPPPKDAKVIDVIKEEPVTPESRARAQAAHDAQMQALTDRVQQLEWELQQAQRVPASVPPPPPPSMAYNGPPSAAGGCDPEFFDCGDLSLSWVGWGWPVYGGYGLARRGFTHRHPFNGPFAGSFGGGFGKRGTFHGGRSGAAAHR